METTESVMVATASVRGKTIQEWLGKVKVTVPQAPSTSEIMALASRTLEGMHHVLQAQYEVEHELYRADQVLTSRKSLAYHMVLEDVKSLGSKVPASSTLETLALDQTQLERQKVDDLEYEKKFLQSLMYYLLEARKMLEMLSRLMYVEHKTE